MCIRDRLCGLRYGGDLAAERYLLGVGALIDCAPTGAFCLCLLYTSDAADERSSVDLGGRRILKKKTTNTSTNEKQKSTHTHHNVTSIEPTTTTAKTI